MNNVQTVTSVALSVEKPPHNEESNEYDPFKHRKVSHPTTDGETLIHLLKDLLGSGILTMPLAFTNGGLWFGLFSTLIVGVIYTYCVHILVKCSHILCRRAKVPSLAFAEVVEAAFLAGPKKFHRWAPYSRFIVNTLLVIDLIGCCCVYNVFVATNVQQMVEYYFDYDINLRYYILLLLVLLIPINLVRNLKHLAPFSVIANILMALGIAITLYYIFIDLPPISERPAIEQWDRLPIFFGAMLFPLEGIGVVMSLENNMKKPAHFIGCPGVLNIGMTVVISLYALIGFMGYWKFGYETEDNVTLNLPIDEILAQLVKLSIAISILLSYPLQFYVPLEIIWKSFNESISERYKNIAEYATRVSLVALTVAIAIGIPTIESFISLIGAVCVSSLGLIFPSIIEILTYHEQPGFGRFNWILYKNILLISFGLMAFVIITFISIEELIKQSYTDFKRSFLMETNAMNS